MKILHILGKILLSVVLPVCLYGQSEVTLQLSKQTVYMGEPLLATIIHSYKKEDRVLKKEFEEFISKDFWLQKAYDVKREKKNGTTYERYEFVISAQKYGTLSVEKQLLRVSHRDPKTNYVKWKEFYTNEVFVEVLPLPANTTVVGNFSIKASIDTDRIKKNKPINLTLTLKGYGNFEDVVPFTLQLPNQTIFTTKPKIETNYKKNQNYGEFTQKISIISDEDYTIPAITLHYFDLKTKKLQTIQTESIQIKVINKTAKKFQDYGYLLFLIGTIFGVFISWIFVLYKKNQKQKITNFTLKEKIKKTKNDKELYKVLLPYCQDERFNIYFHQLEENIFMNKNHIIEKKEILI